MKHNYIFFKFLFFFIFLLKFYTSISIINFTQEFIIDLGSYYNYTLEVMQLYTVQFAIDQNGAACLCDVLTTFFLPL